MCRWVVRPPRRAARRAASVSRSRLSPALRSRSSPSSRSQASADGGGLGQRAQLEAGGDRGGVAAGHEAGVLVLGQPQRQRLRACPGGHAVLGEPLVLGLGGHRLVARGGHAGAEHGLDVDGGADRVERPAGTTLGARHEPGREVEHVDDLAGGGDGGSEHDLVGGLHPGDPGRPVAEPVAGVAVARDQAGPGEQRPLGADRGDHRLLAGDLRGAVLLDVDLAGAGPRLVQRRRLVGVGRAVVGVDRARGDVEPVPGAAGQRVERAPDQLGLPADVEHRVPVTAGDLVVRPGLSAVSDGPAPRRRRAGRTRRGPGR